MPKVKPLTVVQGEELFAVLHRMIDKTNELVNRVNGMCRCGCGEEV